MPVCSLSPSSWMVNMMLCPVHSSNYVLLQRWLTCYILSLNTFPFHTFKSEAVFLRETAGSNIHQKWLNVQEKMFDLSLRVLKGLLILSPSIDRYLVSRVIMCHSAKVIFCPVKMKKASHFQLVSLGETRRMTHVR